MKKIRAIAALLFCVCALCLSAADAADEAITKIKSFLKEAVDEVQKLTDGAEKIRTVEDAVESLTSYYSIVSRFVAEIAAIDEALGARADTKKLFAGIAEIKKQTQALGVMYGAAMGKLPQAILGADEFVGMLQKLKDLSPPQNPD